MGFSFFGGKFLLFKFLFEFQRKLVSYMVCNFSDHVHYQIPQFVYWKLLNILCLCM